MRCLLTVIAVFTVLIAGVPAFAQPAGESDTPAEESERVDRPVKGEEPNAGGSMSESKAASERTLPGGTLAVISYIILWLMTLGFVAFTARRQSQLTEELDSLERRMDSVLGEWDDEV